MKIVCVVFLLVLLAFAGKVIIQNGLDQFTKPNEIDSDYQKLPVVADSQQNPIIVVPGYFGSRLEHAGNRPIAWGAFTKETVDPRKASGARKIALPLDPSVPLAELSDEVFSTSVIDEVKIKLSGFVAKHSVYKNLLSVLNTGGNSFSAHETSQRFEFHYDWRKDNVALAQQLHQFIEKTKSEIEADRHAQFGSEAKPVKFDIVAHSMGGLIARYYLRYGDQTLEQAEVNWAGSRNVDRLLLIAPPNLGSIKSLLAANDGYQGHVLLPKYSGAILSTFPSTYQLFPRDRHEKVVDSRGKPISIYDAELWRQNQWGFFNPQNSKTLAALLPNKSSQERQRIAFEFLSNCLDRACKFHAALDRRVEQPDNLQVYLFSGDQIATPAKLAAHAFDKGNKVFEIIDWKPGDDTVTRRSSLSDERSRESWQPEPDTSINFASTCFVSADHFGITSNNAIFDGLMTILVQKPGTVRPR